MKYNLLKLTLLTTALSLTTCLTHAADFSFMRKQAFEMAKQNGGGGTDVVRMGGAYASYADSSANIDPTAVSAADETPFTETQYQDISSLTLLRTFNDLQIIIDESLPNNECIVSARHVTPSITTEELSISGFEEPDILFASKTDTPEVVAKAYDAVIRISPTISLELIDVSLPRSRPLSIQGTLQKQLSVELFKCGFLHLGLIKSASSFRYIGKESSKIEMDSFFGQSMELNAQESGLIYINALQLAGNLQVALSKCARLNVCGDCSNTAIQTLELNLNGDSDVSIKARIGQLLGSKIANYAGLTIAALDIDPVYSTIVRGYGSMISLPRSGFRPVGISTTIDQPIPNISAELLATFTPEQLRLFHGERK